VTLNPPAPASTIAAPGDLVALSRELLAHARALDERVSPEVRALSAALRHRDPFALTDDAARLAFWINLYNALFRHCLCAMKLRPGATVPLTTYSRAEYTIGSANWSLHVIEHGLLRQNRPAPYTFWRPLRERDPRLGAAPRVFDARVHFALHCGAVSCPPIRAYEVDKLDAQLDLATRAYIAQELTLDRATRTVHLPYLFKLYDRDFGDARAALAWALPYVERDDDRQWLTENSARLRIEWSKYDWTITRA
jgi:hypothetical protein